MLDLLYSFSGAQIVIAGILIILAVKEAISVFEFFYKRAHNHFDNQEEKKDQMTDVIEKIDKLDDKINKITEKQEEIRVDLQEQKEQLTLLTESDKDQLKSFIVREHHYYCYTKKWIDDFSMDALEKCYGHYTAEGGNSYVHDLMDEIRALPHANPDEE